MDRLSSEEEKAREMLEERIKLTNELNLLHE
jgi:hypothetical protein